MSNSINDLKLKFQSLPTKIGLRALRAAGRKAGKIISAEASEKAPVDKGILRDGIIVKTKKESDTEIIIQIGPSSKAWYGAQQEFGNKNHPAQPFLRPAMDEKGHEAAEFFTEELTRQIEKHFK